MHRVRTIVILLTVASTMVTGCVKRSDLPTGEAAYKLIPPPLANTEYPDYKIQPGDRLSVVVFREPDLSLPLVEVNTSGRFAMPLIGSVHAAGQTSSQLAVEISNQLRNQYLRDPNVTVNVVNAALQRVIVDGSVTEPGTFEVRGQTTLMGALSLAKGVNRTAALSEIAVFRRVDGQLTAAKFNLKKIRLGEEPDPEILPNDTVVVGFSQLKSAWRDFLQATPLFAAFRPLYDGR